MPASSGNFRVLIIDDNEVIHSDFRKILGPANTNDNEIERLEARLFGLTPGQPRVAYDIECAEQGREGFEKVQSALKEGRPYALAFVDMRMPPGWDGLTTIEHLWKVDPELQVVICTAYSEYSWEEMVSRFGHTDRLLILKKPFDAVEVRQMACALTVKWNLAKQASLKASELEELVRQRTSELEAQKETLRREIEQRRELESQLLQSQKLEAIGRMAGGVAHDFNNILCVINGRTDLLLERLDPQAPVRRDIEIIGKMGQRAETLTRQLLTFSRKQMLNPMVLDLNSVVRDVQEMLSRVLSENIEKRYEFAEDLGHVKVDPGQVEQALMNLAINARDAMPDGGTLTIRTSNLEVAADADRKHSFGAPAGSYIMLEVTDTGCGMDTSTQTHLFEPFFTTKDKGKGTGLGLSTVYGIVRQSEGYIDVNSAPKLGSSFKLLFPRVADPLSAHDVKSGGVLRDLGTETILLVEDEPDVRNLAGECLRRRGYNVLEALDTRDASRICREYANSIHLMLTDVVMPGKNGPALAEELKLVRPDLRVLFMSGYTDGALARYEVLGSHLNFIAKPFTTDSLARKVREVLTPVAAPS